MSNLVFLIKEENNFKYIEEGAGETIIFLHGLFGTLSNFSHQINYFKQKYKIIVPILPLLETDILHTTIGGMSKFIEKFIQFKELTSFHLLGNSLGGHIALYYALNDPSKIKSLILTGSSGLYENGMGDTFPKRGDYEYIKSKAQLTFYNPEDATKEIVDEVFEITSNRLKAIKIISLAKSAIRNNLANELHKINLPTALIWGKNDIITPPNVAEEFHQLIKNSQLYFLDKCGHAPMLEKPIEFNHILENFLNTLATQQN